jgi:predicted dehydrogenase
MFVRVARMRRMSVRIGVVGVNGIGQAHLFGLPSVEGAQLVAVCDVDAARAEKAGADHNAAVFSDTSALYTSGSVDAVVIATPPGTHGALVRDALDAGLHVYCEKPVTPTCDEGYALAAYARDRGRVLVVGLQFRFHLGYAAMRAALSELGALRRVHLTATNWLRAQRYFDVSPWRTTWSMAGGGVLMSQAVHQLDALIATVGLPARVRGHISNSSHRAEVEDDAVAELEWAGGARGTVVASLSEPAGHERFELYCEGGAITLVDGYDVKVARHDDVQQLIDECPDEFPLQAVTWEPIEVPRSNGEWFDMMMAAQREFIGAITEQRPSTIDADEGTKSVELANAIYLSSCTGEVVDLPLTAGTYPPVFDELAAGRRLLRLGG